MPPPILDGAHNDDPQRIVLHEFGEAIVPYVGEIDACFSLPIRLVHGIDGVCLELGPYLLDRQDIAVLRNAVRAYDEAAS